MVLVHGTTVRTYVTSDVSAQQLTNAEHRTHFKWMHSMIILSYVATVYSLRASTLRRNFILPTTSFTFQCYPRYSTAKVTTICLVTRLICGSKLDAIRISPCNDCHFCLRTTFTHFQVPNFFIQEKAANSTGRYLRFQSRDRSTWSMASWSQVSSESHWKVESP